MGVRGQFRVRLSESRLRIEGGNEIYERDADSGLKILFHVREEAMVTEALRSEFLCSLTGLVAPSREIGTTARGTRRFYPAISGSFEGPRLRGEVLPDGGDWLLTRTDGVLEQDVRINLKTDDGAFIYVRYAGMRHGPPEVMARLAQGETVDPSEYYFRVAPIFETGAERYAWLNKILAVGVGERLPPNIVRYSIFEIL
jgi:hypothetical protein